MLVFRSVLVPLKATAGFLLSVGATSSARVVTSLGLAFATAIAVDAFVVRMTIVPAVMVLLGGRAWWLPRRLDRRQDGGVPDGVVRTSA